MASRRAQHGSAGQLLAGITRCSVGCSEATFLPPLHLLLEPPHFRVRPENLNYLQPPRTAGFAKQASPGLEINPLGKCC